MGDIVAELLTRMHEEVFAVSDPARRRDAIAVLFTDDCLFSDPHGTHIGRDALAQAVTDLLARFPGFRFTLGLRQSLQDAGRQQWFFGLPGEPPKISGLDVVVLSNGKIRALYTFLDP